MRFRRVRLAPCLRVNLSRGGLSLSVGRRGAWYTVRPRGRQIPLGGTETGLFFTQQLPSSLTRGTGPRIALAVMPLFRLAVLVWSSIVAARH
jgi:hypothetical protein